MTDDWGTEYDDVGQENDDAQDSSSAEDGENESEQLRLYFGSVDEWIREWLVLMYARKINGATRFWAAEWWKYPEAAARLESLWRAWEKLRLDPATGMAVWYRDYADHHMRVLMDPDGPFASMEDPKAPENTNTDKKGRRLPYKPPPEGLYPDIRE